MTDSIRSAASSYELDIELWSSFYSKRVERNKQLVAGYLKFIAEMADRGIPPIFEGHHLAKLLGLSLAELSRFTANPEKQYRTFEIPKRSGGAREISTPSPELLECQRWIDWYILRRLPVHDCAHGYVTGRSNRSNAVTHIGSRQVLHLDIRDFFGSIKFRRVISIFLKSGYPRNVAFLLARLCTQGGCVPQGGASSPQLSNVVMYDLDLEIAEFCKSNGLIYSRYVDDIAISGDLIRTTHIAEISRILLESGFLLNEKKTSLQRGRKKIVTGVSIGSGNPKVPRQMRRHFKNQAFIALKNLEHGEQIDEMSDPIHFERCLGQLSYWSMIEPENEKVAKLIDEIKNRLSDLEARLRPSRATR
ncbi:reverse transcriptase domain-containing protein [Qipengyuania aquimaris]|uniref:RNA-directed DNA polymerase n=1 Tax=Qipengyuania aquimaris TaxID=255984 RepID=A0A9Q3S213_9SPHN|nr:reverse transcriptase domain-containing protein [Qipengyuania aquimaris]MBY6218774.1 reverse transcriptase family protein [Qipengyuania aquimaris]